MLFSELAQYLQKLDTTSSRLAITEILSDLFKKTDKNEIDKVCYLILGSLAPRYKNVVFNIADKLMVKSLAQAFGVSDEKALSEYKRLGDLGEVAEILSKNSKFETRKTKQISILQIDNDLNNIAQDGGEGSVERKIENTAKLLTELDPLSAKFVARIPVGKLSLGFSDKTIIDALSWMETGGKGKSKKIEEAYNVLPDVGLLAKRIKESGIDRACEDISPIVGVPVIPALAQRLKSPSEMIEKMGEVAIEPKFDGLRIQIHYSKSNSKSKWKVKAFTRNMNETSWMFPELENIENCVKAEEIILDSEAVGVDEERLTMANFQTTMTRRRKHQIEETSKKVGIKFHVFDCLSVNGESLLNKTYLERRKYLKKYVVSGKLIEVVQYVITKDSSVIESEMKKMLGNGLEGIIVKRVTGRYSSGRTGWHWVKMKEDEDSYAKLADTIDCVVMGYFVGKGKRSIFGLGGFLVGTVKNNKILTLSKIGTGLTDEQFRELKRRLKNLEVKEKPVQYEKVDNMLIPDVWVTPSLVVEIAADDVTKSPNQSSGYSLRFPRLVKFRDDKNWDQATTLGEIKKIFEMKKVG